MKVKKLTNTVRKTICAVLTVAMVCTNTGMTVLAEEENAQNEGLRVSICRGRTVCVWK